MKSPEVISPLLDAVIEDRSPQVRWRAAMTLAKVGDSSVTEGLERALRTEEDAQVVKHIEGALEKIQKRTGSKK